jgi:hypothetical protein
LLNKSVKIMFSLADKMSNAKQVEIISSDDIYDRCFNELIKVVCTIAYQNNLKLEMIMEIQSLNVS